MLSLVSSYFVILLALQLAVVLFILSRRKLGFSLSPCQTYRTHLFSQSVKKKPTITFSITRDSFGLQYGRVTQIARQLECDLDWCIREVQNRNYQKSLHIFRNLQKQISKGIAETRKMMNHLKYTAKSYSARQRVNERTFSLNENLESIDCRENASAISEITIMEFLHDDLLPKLSCIMMGVQVCEDTLFNNSAQVEKKLIKLHEIARDYNHGLLELQYEEGLGNLDIDSLEQAIRDLIYDLEGCTNFTMSLEVYGNEKRISHNVKTLLFNATREAIVNLMKHASPEKAEVELHFKPDEAVVSVVDDGRGFVLDSAMAKAELLGKQGLIRMKNSAQLLGGSLTINTSPKQGTKIVISAPL